MAPSSVQFPPSQRSQQSQNPKADQIVWRYFNKVVLSVANARIISPDSQDPQDASAPGLPVNDYEEGGGTPTGSISVAAPGPSSAVAGGGTAGGSKAATKGKQTGPKVDKWFNLETPDLDTFKPTLEIFKQISTTFPIAPVDIATDPPPLIVQVLLSIPQPSLNKVLVLNHGDNRTRIDPTPRYILLESWRVDITRRIPKSHGTASSTSSSSSFSSSSNSSFYDVELPTVYKQSIALFRSVYTLLRVLPTWKLYRRLRRKRTGPGSGMTLELRVEVPSQSASSSAASSVVDLPLVVDSIPIIGFDTPLSQHHSANKVETRAFSSIPSPLGELNLSLKYRVETNFTLESLESLLSTGLVSTDIQTDLFAPIELFPVSPNPPPNYPKPPYPPISGAAPPSGRKDEAGPSRQPPPPAADDEFDFVSDFTPTVVAEQQRIRRESQTARLAAAGPLIGTSSSGGRNLGPSNVLQGSRSGLPLTQSPRSLPGSLPREPLPGGTSPSPGSTGPTYAIGQPASAVPPRSRYDSTPHSSSPLSNNTNSPRGLVQQPLHSPNPNALTPTQPFPRQQLPPEGQPLHSRTISMPGGTARPPPVPLPATGVSPAPLSSMARMFSREDLPFAAPSTNASGSGGTLIRRVRKESTSALSSTSSGGGGGASPTRPVFTYSPRSRMTPLPSPAPPFGRRESAQLTPPNAVGPVPLPTASGPRRPSLNAIAPFKSSTLSSSPSSFGAGRINSPISERITSSPLHPGAASRQLVVGAGTGFSQSPRSPIPMAMRQAGAVGTADSSPNSNPYGSPSPAPQGVLSSKRLSGSSMESAGVAGVTSRRLSGHATQSPELAGAGVPVPPKRYSSSFTHRYRDSTSTTGSAALVTGAGGVPGSVGSGSGAGGTSLGLAGVGVGEPRRLDTLYSAASTDDDDIQALVQAIENRPQLRGGTPPISRLSSSPASHPSVGSLPRTQTAEGEGAAGGRPSLSSLNTSIQQQEASLPLIHEDTVAASPSSRTPADIRVPVTSARDLDDRLSAMTAQFNESIGAVARTRLQSNPSTPSEDVRTGGRSAFVSAVSRSGNGSPRGPVTRLASRERSELGHRRSGSGTGMGGGSR